MWLLLNGWMIMTKEKVYERKIEKEYDALYAIKFTHAFTLTSHQLALQAK